VLLHSYFIPLLPFGNHHSLQLCHLKQEIHFNNIQGRRKKMKIRKVLKEIVRKDGKHSLTANAVNRLKTSKEFSYLVDINKV